MASLRELAAAMPKVEMIKADENLGVGVALNLIALAAILAGFEKLCLLDQDSSAGSGLLTTLVGRFRLLEGQGHRPPAVAPRLVSPASGRRSKPLGYVVSRSMSAPTGTIASGWPSSGNWQPASPMGFGLAWVRRRTSAEPEVDGCIETCSQRCAVGGRRHD